jgi:hypothetical protein
MYGVTIHSYEANRRTVQFVNEFTYNSRYLVNSVNLESLRGT